MTTPDIATFERVGVKVHFTDEGLAFFNERINSNLQEQVEADLLAEHADDPNIASKVPNIVEMWSLPDDRADYLNRADEIRRYRTHGGQVLDVVEWGEFFTADVKISASKSVRAFRKLDRLAIDGIHMASRNALVSAPWNRRGHWGETWGDFLGFVVDPALADQEATGYVIPDIDQSEAFEALSPLLVASAQEV
ncbi:MAG: hypothetical protein JWO35_813 [Candidatus Saccharibacteria bacterium]|nr:hypothetical protein [Candidatus Saccharibacteria bacterium]